MADNRNYDFVPYTEREIYNRTEISGYYDISVTTVQPLRIGCGQNSTDISGMKSEILRFDGSPVIPGSSLKGCVRGIAAAVSRSCSPDNRCKADNRCIVCDTFGTLSFAGRVDFDDLKAPKDTKILSKSVPVPFMPKIKKEGYKFYRKKDAPTMNGNFAPKLYTVEAVGVGTVFTGRVYFRKVTEEELSLLVFSMGYTGNEENFLPKLGGNRAHGFGSVKIEITNERYIGRKPSKYAAELSKEYSANASDDCLYNINKLKQIFS